MMYFLLMDFGTTSLKTAVVDLDTGRFSHIKSHLSLHNCSTQPGRYEVSPEALTAAKPCAISTSTSWAWIKGIAVCSEQNGVLVLDEHDRPVTSYISRIGRAVRRHCPVRRAERRFGTGRARSAADQLRQWKDERSLEPIDGVGSFQPVVGQGRAVQAHHGHAPGPTCPDDVAHLGVRPVCPESESGWCPSRSGWTCPAATRARRPRYHAAQSELLRRAGARETSDELVRFVEDLTGRSVHVQRPGADRHGLRVLARPGADGPDLCRASATTRPGAGRCNEPRRTDLDQRRHQLPGSGHRREPGWGRIRAAALLRRRLLSAMTRIPAGRALAGFIGLLEEIAGGGGEAISGTFWASWPRPDVAGDTPLRPGDVRQRVGLRGGGRESPGISDGPDLKNYLASLLKSWMAQYAGLIRLFDPTRHCALHFERRPAAPSAVSGGHRVDWATTRGRPAQSTSRCWACGRWPWSRGPDADLPGRASGVWEENEFGAWRISDVEDRTTALRLWGGWPWLSL